MWFWKITISFFLSQTLVGCAPYYYYGIGDIVADSDVRRPLLKSGSRKTRIVREVSETKSTNTIPTRGLFYPDDMFFTNWVPSAFTNENCTTNQSSGTTPSCSISKSTLKTKNNDKSNEHQTTIGQQKSTSAVKSSLRRQQTSTSGVLSSSSRVQASTLGVLSSSSSVLTSSFALPSSLRRQKTPTPAGLSSSRLQKTSTFAAPSLPRRRKPSTIAVTSSRRHKKTSKFDVQSSTSSDQTSTFVASSLSRRHRTLTPFVPSSPASRVDGRSMMRVSPHDSDFEVVSSTSGQQNKYSSQHSSSLIRKSTFDVASSSGGHRKPTRSSVTTTADYTSDLDDLSYSE